MRPCVALLTMKMSKLPSSVLQEEGLLIDALKTVGIQTEWLEWDSEIALAKYDLVLVRTTWDYQARFSKFISVLKKIEQSQAELMNSLATISWNIDKNYLFQLEKLGIPIVPTKKLKEITLKQAFSYFQCQEVVVKPTISASAHHTFVISRNRLEEGQDLIASVPSEKEMLVQPVIESVLEEGEFSLHFFDHVFSHAVLKKPKKGDFRSQEEYGSKIQAVTPPKDMLEMAMNVLAVTKNLLGESLLYARVDLVRAKTGFALMELELIEPCLYLNHDDKAPSLLVEKIKARLLTPKKESL